ncbi:MAG TPA: T9SS type A sorting domain-containing protein, partial [Saprospiraceae bacterium]|nr:T9SS type A sorting domain-containing protein [Saprospiraceae bacterium]
GHPNLYVLIHLGARYEPEKKLRYGPLYYTVIDMSLENGKGAVVSKNNVLLDASLEPFAAVRHGNGRDWWLVVPKYATNRYYRFLLSPEGLNNAGDQQIGPALTCKQIRPSVFSPDGAHFAKSQNCGVCVLDFDRCSGFFANPRLMSWPPHAFGGGGVAFSPNSEVLYATTQMAILSADLTAPTPQLDTAVAWNAIAGNSLSLMQYGPDGKLYIGNMGRSSNYHVFGNLNNPDPALDFQIQGLALPVQVVRTLPNYPNFRLLDLAGSACDTLNINTSISTHLPFTTAPFIAVSPNPANEAATVTISGARKGQLTLRSVDGRLMMQTTFISDAEKSVQVLDLTSYPTGSYFLSLLSEEGGAHSALINIQR